MDKKLTYLVIALLVLINSVLLVKVFGTDHNEPEQIKEQQSSDSALVAQIRYYHADNVINAQLNNNIRLDKELRLTGIDNRDVKLKSLVFKGPKLIVRTNETGCGTCIENEIKKIERFGKIIGDTNIVVITTFSNVRKSIVFKQTNNISLRIFTCPDLGLPFEKASNKPFLFLLGPDLITQHFFIPEISESEVSQGYYSAIYKRYFRSASPGQPVDIPVL